MTEQRREPLPPINERTDDDQPEASRDSQVKIEAGQPPQVTLRHTAASSADDQTRRNMQNADGAQGVVGFTRGNNANAMERSGLPYASEDMARHGAGPARGADVPAGSGATPISADRDAFLNDMVRLGRFADAGEADTWATAVFNALRQRALASDKAIAAELGAVVRVGEAPEVQVAEMIWGGDFVARLRTLIGALSDVNKDDFLRSVATYASRSAEDPWVEGAVYSFFGALKSRAGDIDASRLGELGQVWQHTQ